MLTPNAASLLVQAMACMARVEGMKAENQHRVSNGYSVAYGEEAFEEQAKTLDYLAMALIHQ